MRLLFLFRPSFWLAVLSLVLIFPACNAPDTPLPPPNILWITSEDTGLAWGCYGDTYAYTPHIDSLAADGSLLFSRAFSNAPICAPARSTLITGIYATSLGTQHLRSEIPVPADLKLLPELLHTAGYYTTNHAKTDYNFSPEDRWDESSQSAHWRNRAAGQPFFSVFNFGITHEGHTNRLDANDTQHLARRHDPAEAIMPPYFPDTPTFRQIWAHAYDLISVFDQEVGKLIAQLKEDGLYDNTLIFVFSDHGVGLPRNKRWLYQSGMQVPFLLRVPKPYRHLVSNTREDQMIGFVDVAPTVLAMAGQPIPERMEGVPFAGPETREKAYIFGYRDRADDCYDMGRSVFDGRYRYVRNFMPHKPYIQNAVIFNRSKGSFEELYRVRKAHQLPPGAEQMFAPKPVEALYDLDADPHELNNLLEGGAEPAVATKLRERLFQWMLAHHDSGLLHESEMLQRAQATGSVYEMTHDPNTFNGKALLAAAQQVGALREPKEVLPSLASNDAGVRFWALVALEAYPGSLAPVKASLNSCLNDPSDAVAIQAARLLAKREAASQALDRLQAGVRSEHLPTALQAAIAIRDLGQDACPLLPLLKQEVMPLHSGQIWGRYKNWMYPMFIGMSIDQVRINCGEEVTFE